MQQAVRQNRIYAAHAEKHSVSFCLAAVLIVCLLLQYYLPVFIETQGTFFGAYLYPLISSVGLFACLILFALRNIRIPHGVLLALAGFLLASVASVLVSSSGIERTLGLLSLLTGLYAFHADPPRKSEMRILVALFAVAVILILPNGELGDAKLLHVREKFNPNGCAFLLTMLYCVFLVRFFSTKRWGNLLLCALCFALQFLYISRTALLGILLFTALTVICSAWRKVSFSPSTVFWLLLIFPVLGILLAWFYAEVLFPAVGYGKIILFGKDLFTGRQVIWGLAFGSVREHFWFGVGGHLNEAEYLAGSSYGELVMNAHNQPLGMLASFGFFATAIFFFAFARFAAYPYRGGNRADRFPAIFLLTITVMSYFDLYFFSQYNQLPILIAYGLMFTRTVPGEKA